MGKTCIVHKCELSLCYRSNEAEIKTAKKMKKLTKKQISTILYGSIYSGVRINFGRAVQIGATPEQQERLLELHQMCDSNMTKKQYVDYISKNW